MAATTFAPTPPAACVTLRGGSDSLILIGTYKLDEATGSRTGSLLLNKLEHEPLKLTQIQVIDLDPSYGSVLDIAQSTPHLILIAASRGRILSFTLNDHDTLSFAAEHVLFDDDTLVLSLAAHPTDRSLLSCTLSDSSVALLKLTTSASPTIPEIEVLSTIENAHNGLEAWTSSLGSNNVLYTGGDDASFAVWDVSDTSSPPSLFLRNRNTHGAGVTAILPLEGGRVVLTGSYDSRIRAYDTVSRRFVKEMDLEGGVWRLQRLTAGGEKMLVLANCMHAGCRIVGVDIQIREEKVEVKFEVVGRMEEHESMNYASTAVECEKGWSIVSTSFYDKRVCLWGFDGPEQ